MFKFTILFIISFEVLCEVAGTPARDEVEFKQAYLYKDNINLKKVFSRIKLELKKKINDNKFHFPKLIKEEFSLEQEEMRNFLFLDYYFDTKNFDLFKRSSDYRLRYRWKYPDYYLFYEYFPFLSIFWPSRCEIQFKTNYKYDHSSNIVSVRESRFEFRDDSLPFSTTNPAPRSPWSSKNYIEIAKSGRFQNYIMQPFYDLSENLKVKAPLSEVLKIKTYRFRNHLNIKNPWGSGPNPEQAFIFTFDFSEGHKKENDSWVKIDQRVLEIEIEIERNISTNMEIFAKKENGLILKEYGDKSELFVVKNYSMRGLELLRKDLDIIKNVFRRSLASLKLEKMPLDHKYSRFIKLGEIK